MQTTDLRVVKTLKQIDQALLESLADTPFEKITVDQLCRAALINRSTFYKYYTSKFDLMDRYLQRALDGFRRQVDVAFVNATPETVVLLSHKKPDSYIHIDVEFGEGEGKIPVDKIVQRAEKYKPKERVTYKRIKEYVLEKYGFKVHTAYIAEVKRSLGLPMYDAPNAVEELKQPRKHPTPEKVEAIKDALHYFAVI